MIQNKRLKHKKQRKHKSETEIVTNKVKICLNNIVYSHETTEKSTKNDDKRRQKPNNEKCSFLSATDPTETDYNHYKLKKLIYYINNNDDVR